VDGGGRHWKPDTYVAMTMRSTYHNVSRAAFWERNEEYANDLYLVTSYAQAFIVAAVINRHKQVACAPRRSTPGRGRCAIHGSAR